MAHEIFISYSVEDRKIAEAVCNALEKEHIKCWIAPRDILPGDIYTESIIDAISDSSLIVLVFSSRANASRHVVSEVDRAYNKSKSIIRFNIEDVPLTKSLEYYLSTAQWLDTFSGPMENHLRTLTGVV